MVGALLREGLIASGLPAERISAEVYGEEEAVRRGLETAQPGDLPVIFGDKLERVWEQIVTFGRPAGAAGNGGAAGPRAEPVFSPTTPVWVEPAASPPPPARRDPGPRAERGED